ncbi:MAG: enoyl-CoA hydratase/isomerase family protein [Thermodesulfobacteriota bacterium]|nr:enoyl-CoA hydratase/isomerase family protein [Thermodesulfobacteriota bacterium]
MATEEKEFGTVKVVRKENFAEVIMNRPEKLNALSPELIHDFIAAWNNVKDDDGVRALIITGAGESFSAGGDVVKDINPLRDMSASEFRKYFGVAEVLYEGIINIEKPVIAAINGYAVGAGLDLALSCDIRIAAEDAKMAEFFVRMGLTPELGIYMLPRLVGVGWAKLICLTGDLLDAAQAEKIGLVEKVVPPDQLIPEAEKMAKKLANGPVAIGTIKKAINESLKMTLESSIDYISSLQYQLCHTEDHKEAVTSWLEKRKPVFKGK